MKLTAQELENMDDLDYPTTPVRVEVTRMKETTDHKKQKHHVPKVRFEPESLITKRK
jgi:hypothetical protein